jgi:hypothetical protein
MNTILVDIPKNNKVKSTFSTQLMNLSIYIGVMLHFQNVMNQGVTDILHAVSLVGGYFGITLFLLSHGNKVNKICYWWIVVCVYMFLLGLINPYGGTRSLYILFKTDLRYCMYMMIGLCYATPQWFSMYRIVMKKLMILAAVFGIIALFLFDYNLNTILYRSNTWTMPYYLWWLPGSVFAFAMSEGAFGKTNKKICYAALGAYLILGILFLKRATIVNVTFLYVFIFFAKVLRDYSYKEKLLRFFLIVVIACVLIFAVTRVPTVSNIANMVFDRFVNSEIDSYDRAVEAETYFRECGIMQIITGTGMGITSHNYSSLHIGFYNNILKGGLVLFGFWFCIFIKSVASAIKIRRLDENQTLCLCVTVSALLSLFFRDGLGADYHRFRIRSIYWLYIPKETVNRAVL